MWPQRNLAIAVAALLLALGAPAARAQPQPRPRAAITAAGPGIVVGDWRLGVIVTTGTDDSNDTVNNQERARIREYNAAEARRQGQVQESPAAKLLPGARREPPKPLGPGFAVAQKVRRQLVEGQAATAGRRDQVTQRAGTPRRAAMTAPHKADRSPPHRPRRPAPRK